MSLTSLFTQPFNRLTKLRLQIYDLAKVTPTTTRDYEDCLLVFVFFPFKKQKQKTTKKQLTFFCGFQAQAQVQDVCDDVNTLKHLHDDVFTNVRFLLMYDMEKLILSAQTPFDKKLHFDPLFMAPSRRTLLHYDGLDQYE